MSTGESFTVQTKWMKACTGHGMVRNKCWAEKTQGREHWRDETEPGQTSGDVAVGWTTIASSEQASWGRYRGPFVDYPGTHGRAVSIPYRVALLIDATALLRCYARWRLRQLASEDPATAQQRQLFRLLRRAASTRFGQMHGFGRIRDVRTFQQRVPIRRYEDFWRDWWQPAFPCLSNISWPGLVRYFAVSSGTTTGDSKYIPVSGEMVSANRRAALDVLVHHLANRTDSCVLAGRNFVLGGSVDLVRHGRRIYSGDLSGIAANEVPWWARPRYFPPRSLAFISDWQQKMQRLAPLSLAADIRSISGTPSWLLMFFAQLALLKPELPPRSASWYPNLELCVHGGVNFAPYKAQFDAVFAGSRVDVREVYPASEGFIAIADRGNGEGLRLITDNGLFYEFIPADEANSPAPTRHWLEDIECGVNYAVVLSSNAGLWSYLLGDTIRFVERHPPRLLVTGRLSYGLSAFGEHLIGEELEAAIAKAARAIGGRSIEYAVAAEFPARAGDLGRHSFVIEIDPPADDEDATRFADALDRSLAEQNADYRAHRAGMHRPAVMAVVAGSFAKWMQQRSKAGGQNKVPRVIADWALFSSLQRFMCEHGYITGHCE
jgi:hypothetical protein